MSHEIRPQSAMKPRLNPMFLLRWEKTQNAHVLLYPEGVIKLNASAAEILKCCDGDMTVAAIVDKLKTLFTDVGEEDLATGINTFLETAYAKGWIGNHQP